MDPIREPEWHTAAKKVGVAAAKAGVELPQITSHFNNFDFNQVRGNSQEMSMQQRKILQLLEGGFKGSVEDVLRAAGNPYEYE